MFLSFQIVHPTALPEILRSNMAAHQKRRSGIVRVTASAGIPDAGTACLFRLGKGTDIAKHLARTKSGIVPVVSGAWLTDHVYLLKVAGLTARYRPQIIQGLTAR